VSSRRRPVVLHVSEAVTAGVPAGVKAVIDRSPDARHTVVLVPRKVPDGSTPRHPAAEYIEVAAPVGAVAAMRAVARAYRELRPDVVHAHSSFAGVYVRALPIIPRARIVYSPHCFAFERQDVGRTAQRMFRVTERALALRTRAVLAFSEREAELARGLSSHVAVAEASYEPDLPDGWNRAASAPVPGRPLVVAASGRLCAQKDPSFFAAVVRRARAMEVDAHWIWVGDGDTAMRRELEDVGVDVTGWMHRREVFDVLVGANVFLHTARWEATPIAAVEAAALGLPIVLRRVPATERTTLGVLVPDADDAVVAVQRLAEPSAWTEQRDRSWLAIEAMLHEHDLGAALAYVYALDGRPANGPAERLRSVI
jgi:glycosyltransferase involved in cell wall biosynthesis